VAVLVGESAKDESDAWLAWEFMEKAAVSRDAAPVTTGPPLPLLLIPDETLKPETDNYVRVVRSPSRHRYYGNTPTNDAPDLLPEPLPKVNDENESDVFLTVPDDPARSAPPSSEGTDEFRLLPMAEVVPVRDRIPTVESPEEPAGNDPVPPEPPFEAFPSLRRSSWWSWCTPNRVAAVECGITLVLVLAAFVDSIVQSVKGNVG